MSKQLSKISIHKSNAMIRGGNTYSLNAQRLANGIYNYIQKNNYYEKIPFKIPIQDVREIMNLSRTNAYVQVVKKALMELSTPFVLYDPKDLIAFHAPGKEVLWKSVQFLTDAAIVKEGKKIYIAGALTESIRILIAYSNNGNFTPLLLNGELKELKSKHSYIMYEYVTSFNDHPKYNSRIEFRQPRLDKMFNLQDSKKYKYFSSFLPVLERCIIDINDNTNLYLKLVVDKKRKIYIVYRIRSFNKKVNEPTTYTTDKGKEIEFDHPVGLF